VVFAEMGWRYNAGLGLIGTVVFIWVASAEITQVRVHHHSLFSFFSDWILSLA
jgi:hypothetical protein